MSAFPTTGTNALRDNRNNLRLEIARLQAIVALAGLRRLSATESLWSVLASRMLMMRRSMQHSTPSHQIC